MCYFVTQCIRSSIVFNERFVYCMLGVLKQTIFFCLKRSVICCILSVRTFQIKKYVYNTTISRNIDLFESFSTLSRQQMFLSLYCLFLLLELRKIADRWHINAQWLIGIKMVSIVIEINFEKIIPRNRFLKEHYIHITFQVNDRQSFVPKVSKETLNMAL